MWGGIAVEHLGVCKLNKPTAFDRNCCINNVGVGWQCRHLSHQLFGAGYPQLCRQRKQSGVTFSSSSTCMHLNSHQLISSITTAYVHSENMLCCILS